MNGYLEQKSLIAILAGVLVAITALFGAAVAQAGTLEAMPRVIIRYAMNDNIYSDDLDRLDDQGIDPATASFMDYLVGLDLKYAQGRSIFTVGGEAGYEQYISLGGRLEDAPDDAPQDYDYIKLRGDVEYVYLTSVASIVIADRIMQTRDLKDVFGEGTDAMGYWSLYTNNEAMVSLRLRPTNKISSMIVYTYHTIIFADPENEVIKPADSYEHRGIWVSEYRLSGRITTVFDLQFGTREFEEVDNQKFAGFDSLQGMIGLRYHRSETTNMHFLVGAVQKQYKDVPEDYLPVPPWPANTLKYDLEDKINWVADAGFSNMKSGVYNFNIKGQQGISTYGQNIFFTYSLYGTDFTYFFTPKIKMDLSGTYRYAVYSIEDNGQEWRWEEDRIDEITTASASINYDILQKNSRGSLSVTIGYNYILRNSTIDENNDYTLEYQSYYAPGGQLLDSFDAAVNVYYVTLSILPTILIGN